MQLAAPINLMEVSRFNDSPDLQYWGSVDEVIASVFWDEIEEIRPSKQLRTDNQYSFIVNTKNCKLNNTSQEDRIVAERIRRQKMSQKFSALSALLPPLQKRDKAYILKEAINYITQLQKKVDNLEKKIRKRGDGGAVGYCCSYPPAVNTQPSPVIPLIKAKCCNSEVLITIHCDKREGLLENIVAIIENHNSSVLSCSLVQFGDFELNLTIIAQMEEGMKIDEVVNNVHAALSI